MKTLLVSSFVAAGVLASAASASAHARLMTPTPLTQDDNAKAGPCGCYFGAGPEDPGEDGSPLQCPGDFQVTTLTAGEELTVTWEETVNHNGDFRISFSPKPPAETKKADVDAESAIALEIPDENGMSGGVISRKVVVPDEPCTLCTIQLRQFMIGASQPYYYSCAAVKIVPPDASMATTSSGAGGGGDGGAGVGAGMGAGASDGQGGGAGSTGAGMADPHPKIEEGCSFGPGGVAGGATGVGTLAIVGVSAIAGLARRRRSRRAPGARKG